MMRINIGNWLPHVKTGYVVLLNGELKMVNLQTSTFKVKQWLEIETQYFEKIEKRHNVKQLKRKFNPLQEHRIFAYFWRNWRWMEPCDKHSPYQR